MSKFLTALLPNLSKSINSYGILPQMTCQKFLHISCIDMAARKGTREKARKKKVKVEVAKVKFTPTNKKLKAKALAAKKIDLHKSDDDKPEPIDDVFIQKFFRTKPFSVVEALKKLQQYNHPTRYDSCDANVYLNIHVNMQSEKKTKFRETFSRLALTPHPMQIDTRRTILVFCKDPELQNKLIEAGAAHSGGMELVKQIQTGDLKLQNYQYFLAHFPILTELLPIKGLLKKNFPSVQTNTVAEDIEVLLKKYLNGVVYTVKRDDFQINFGSVMQLVGKLDMDPQMIEQNIVALIKDLNSMRPKREGLFITKSFLKTEFSDVMVPFDPFVYVERERPKLRGQIASMEQPTVEEEDSDSDDEDTGKAKATA